MGSIFKNSKLGQRDGLIPGESFRSLLPGIATSIWQYQLPWLLKPALMILKALSSRMNAGRIVSINGDEALKAMGPDRLPDSMGRNKKIHPLEPPKDSPDMIKFAKENNLITTQILTVLNEPIAIG